METKGLSVYFLESDEVDMYVLATSFETAQLACEEEEIKDVYSCEELAPNMYVEKVDDYGVMWRVLVDDLLRDLQTQHGDCEKIDMSKGYFVLSELYKEQ